VIENVPQFLSHFHDGKKGGIAEQVIEILGEMGYQTDSAVLNAADYGVPQLRQRALIVASRVGAIRLPAPTCADPALKSGLPPWVTVREALGDLPLDPPMKGEDSEAQRYAGRAGNAYARWMRTGKEFPDGHITRSYQKRIIDIIQQMRPGETWDDASERLCALFDQRVAKAVAAGESERAARRRLEAEGKVIATFYKRYYWSAYTRLDWDRPALTITANANFLGSGRFTHPERDRGITIREAARLQSFDDAFTFRTDSRGKDKIGVALDMIGEAVPPLMGKVIGETVASHLDCAGSEEIAEPSRSAA
jgi:DNA (cytosine-5)-methyltransferase 1